MVLLRLRHNCAWCTPGPDLNNLQCQTWQESVYRYSWDQDYENSSQILECIHGTFQPELNSPWASVMSSNSHKEITPNDIETFIEMDIMLDNHLRLHILYWTTVWRSPLSRRHYRDWETPLSRILSVRRLDAIPRPSTVQGMEIYLRCFWNTVNKNSMSKWQRQKNIHLPRQWSHTSAQRVFDKELFKAADWCRWVARSFSLRWRILRQFRKESDRWKNPKEIGKVAGFWENWRNFL